MVFSYLLFWKFRGEASLRLLQARYQLLLMRNGACTPPDQEKHKSYLNRWARITALQSKITSEEDALLAAQNILALDIPALSRFHANSQESVSSPQLRSFFDLQKIMIDQTRTLIIDFLKRTTMSVEDQIALRELSIVC